MPAKNPGKPAKKAPAKKTLVVTIKPKSPSVEIGYMPADHWGSRDWESGLSIREYPCSEFDEVSLQSFMEGSELYMVLGESDKSPEWAWRPVNVKVTLGADVLFEKSVSPDDPHGIVFEETQSPLAIDFDIADKWLVASDRVGEGWTWKSLKKSVPADFRFDPAKLTIPYFRLPIDFAPAPAALCSHGEIRYEGLDAPAGGSPDPDAVPPSDAVFLWLSPRGVEPAEGQFIGLSNQNWVKLLCHRAEFADRAPWNKFSRADIARLSKFQPRLWVEHAGSLSGETLSAILAKQPQLAPKLATAINPSALDGRTAIKLLKSGIPIEGKFAWSKLNGRDWCDLLIARPEFADRCAWSKLDGVEWCSLLEFHPQFADKCDKWSKLKCWPSLLRSRPQFADKCDKWRKFKGWETEILLREHPELANRCDWSTLDGSAWGCLLQYRPQFADKCDWSKLDGADWAALLAKKPRFADKCDWSKLTAANWRELLKARPMMKKFMPKKSGT